MTSLFSGKHDVESRRAEVIQEMVERLERVGDKLPIHLQIQMKECIAAFRHETATGIKTEWTIIKGHHGSADRAAQAGVQKYKTIITTGRGGHTTDGCTIWEFKKV